MTSFTRGRKAAGLRREQSVPEAMLWKQLRGRIARGLKFRRQYPLGLYVLDFYCVDARLCVEVDSANHRGREARDAQRDRWLREQGVEVLRVRAIDVSTALDKVVARIKEIGTTRIAEQEEKDVEKAM